MGTSSDAIPAVGQSGIEFRVLGPVEVVQAGLPANIGGPRQRALLALLLLQRGQATAADSLIDDLWAGEPPDGASATLRSYVSRLRQALGYGAQIVGTSTGYRLDVDARQVDAAEFERLIRAADESVAAGRLRSGRDGFAEAMALWRGRPFADLADDGSLAVEADRLEELRLHALEERLAVDIELGRSPELADELEALVRRHPYRERLWRSLMLALYHSGRQADALAAFQRARQMLDEQLGLEPGVELQQLEVAILRQELPAVSPPEERHNLPAPLTSFIGRTDQLDSIVGLLKEHRLVTLTGVGGVGKTRLALELARRLLPEYTGGAWFIDLAPIVEPSLVARHMARVLGVQEQSDGDPKSGLIERLRGIDVLLVVDNCEHVLETCAELLQSLLGALSDLRILATSRERLAVPGEIDFAVNPLGVATAHDASRRTQLSEAATLFLDRARAGRPGMRLDEKGRATAERICADLDGLPLAIELAAARAKALSLDVIATELSDRFRFLVNWRRLTPARHRTLREAMDWSYELLSEKERRLLRGLSVFVGGFTVDSVANVCLDDDHERALMGIERLVEASLVVPRIREGEGRYRLLETVRQYGAEKLEGSGDGQMARREHARYFAALAEESWQPIRLGNQPEWVARLAEEQDNLRAALAWARKDQDNTLLARLAEGLWWFWWVHGDVSEGRVWLDAALDGSPAPEPGLLGRTLLGAAGLAWAQGDLDRSAHLADEAVRVFQPLSAVALGSQLTGVAMWMGSALNTLGLVVSARGDQAAARPIFEQALSNFESVSDPTWRLQNTGVVLHNLGSIASEEGDLEETTRLYQRARAIFDELSDVEGVAMCDLYLGVTDVSRDRFDEAREPLTRALNVYASVGFLQYLAQCVEAVAVIANADLRLALASTLLGAAEAMREKTGNPPMGKFSRLVSEVRESLEHDAGPDFERHWNAGKALAREATVSKTREALSG